MRYWNCFVGRKCSLELRSVIYTIASKVDAIQVEDHYVQLVHQPNPFCLFVSRRATTWRSPATTGAVTMVTEKGPLEGGGACGGGGGPMASENAPPRRRRPVTISNTIKHSGPVGRAPLKTTTKLNNAIQSNYCEIL